MMYIGTALRQASFCVEPLLWRVGCVGGCGGHRWSLAVMYISLSIDNIEKKDIPGLETHVSSPSYSIISTRGC
jgi:hypothetical protein